jgi:hypothetical protein
MVFTPARPFLTEVLQERGRVYTIQYTKGDVEVGKTNKLPREEVLPCQVCFGEIRLSEPDLLP